MAGEERSYQLEKILRGHFLHPHHLLHLDARAGYTEFICNGCHFSGKGTRYRCDPCKFDLHVYCAHCPHTLLSPLHPAHRLTLLRKLCAVCSKSIPEQTFYRCYACEMDFHLSCVLKSNEHSIPPKELSSPLHPRHQLRRGTHSCNDCKVPLKGMFYRCKECDFDLDPLCQQKTMTAPAATSPAHQRRLSFFMHPEHDLSFVERIQPSSPDSVEELRCRWCAVCGEPAEENCYTCHPCRFRVHKHCASLRPAVRDEAHPAHALHYLRSKPIPCKVCKESCALWRYHCAACGVHVHKHCLMGPAPAAPPEEAMAAQLRLTN